VTGWRWFRGGRLNYAEAALRPPSGGGASLAVIARSQTRPAQELTWSELTDRVARVRTGLLTAGVRPGEVVAGYLPNIPETLAAMLACASLGAIWACCAPEMGVTGALDRLAQLRPAVLLSIDGYRYGARSVDRAAEAGGILAGLPTVRRAVWLPYLTPDAPAPAGWTAWGGFTAARDPLEFASLEFDHPLYTLFSSGTTGRPKAIVHSHGGILLEHLKTLGFHFDLGAGDRFFWFSTTGWMMWNLCVSGLAVGATVVLFDGDPMHPGIDALWDLVASTGATCAGTGSSYLAACAKAGVRPAVGHDLGALRTLGATGSPLPALAARWVYREVKAELLLASFSGGTDVCTGFVGGSPLHPVWAGEISCRCLGARVEVVDEGGRQVVGREGELVLTAPLPSMPVGFWDDDGTRYRAAYFERFPGMWAHGDRATLTERGTVVITGRSDGTLNRGGVRMGTAEFYAVIERMPQVADSLVVHLEDPDGGPGELWLFLVEGGSAEAGSGGQEDLARRVCDAIRRELSPRYVPDRVVSVPALPRTLSGKKLEVPVKRLLMGRAVSDAVALSAVANPESLEPFVSLGRERAGQAAG
jgi:acetoacetyl-CoA synthetase